MVEFKIDYSELDGRKVSCPPECGMCCLCQPEVLPEERNYFRVNYSSSMVKKREPHEHFALALKKGKGSCVFLDSRRCKIYENRPTYCRQFPYHFYLGDKVTVELDMSCRGAWTGTGENAVEAAGKLADAASGRLKVAFKESRAVYSEFYGICEESGVMADVSSLRRQVSSKIDDFTDMGFLAKVMEMSLEEPLMSLVDITSDPKFDLKEMTEAAMDAALGSMSSQDPLSVPVYCDNKWNWNLFMAGKNGIEWNVLTDQGDMLKKGSVDPTEIQLPSLDTGGQAVLKDYLSLLNRRESMLGNVFHTMDSLGYEDDMSNVYFGSLSVAVLDLMWRSSMLNHFISMDSDAERMKESIIFYDMDRLDAPTIGAFV